MISSIIIVEPSKKHAGNSTCAALHSGQQTKNKTFHSQIPYTQQQRTQPGWIDIVHIEIDEKHMVCLRDSSVVVFRTFYRKKTQKVFNYEGEFYVFIPFFSLRLLFLLFHSL